jgi:cytidine deaminase
VRDFDKYMDSFHSEDEESPCVECRQRIREDYEQNVTDRIRKEGR